MVPSCWKNPRVFILPPGCRRDDTFGFHMKLIRCLLLSSLIPPGLGACALNAPTARTNTPLPAAWKNAAGFPVASPTRDLTRWWKYFNDPVLTRVIADGLANSPDVASAAARIREAQARRNETAASLFPAVDGSSSANSSTVKNQGARQISITSYSAGLHASWEADLFGKNRNTVAAATAEVGAAAENLHSVQAALASEIAIAYTRLRANEIALTVLVPHRQEPRANLPARKLAPTGRRGGLARIQPSPQQSRTSPRLHSRVATKHRTNPQPVSPALRAPSRRARCHARCRQNRHPRPPRNASPSASLPTRSASGPTCASPAINLLAAAASTRAA